jgi:hypothetical protein
MDRSFSLREILKDKNVVIAAVVPTCHGDANV